MTYPELVALLPVLILVFGALVVLLAGAWYAHWQNLILGGIGCALLAALTAMFCPAPVVEVANLYGAGAYARFFTALWSLLAALVLLLSVRYGEERQFDGGVYAALTLFAAAGMSLLSAATSLIGLFLGLEAYTLVLYILIAFDRESSFAAEAGLKYLVLGAVATGFMAFGIALIYLGAGTFHLPEAFTAAVVDGHLRPYTLFGWVMLLAAVGFKISLVPFHLWTPDVYQGAPAPVGGLLATGSKGAVVAALAALYFANGAAVADITSLLWLLAAVTMLVGTFQALAQRNLKRMLAFSSVVHMGYLLIGLLAGGDAGFSAIVFYIVVYTFATLGSFAVIASLSHAGGEPQEDQDIQGLGYRYAFRGALLAIFLVSLAGLPPTAGFIGKFGLFAAAIKGGQLSIALIGIFASLVSVYYYLRIVIVMYMAKVEPQHALHPGHRAEYAVLLACMVVVMLLGVFPGPLLDLAAFIAH
ncbi:MAG: NADH-quinone oxidoreductase subunit N [Desulfuromonas sp.]|nr:MAG: NADH-quinone oxidoreductase subunit N [Desulfuromonas sp.]